jgi:hypothetical protein
MLLAESEFVQKQYAFDVTAIYRQVLSSLLSTTPHKSSEG